MNTPQNPAFRPFALLLRLVSPTIMTAQAPVLDALVYEGLSQRHCQANQEELYQRMEQGYLAFNKDLGVFHASSLWFVMDGDTAVTPVTVARVDRRTPEKMSSWSTNAIPPGSKRRMRKFRNDGGVLRNRLHERAAYAAPYALFFGLGDPLAIKQLFDFFHIGVGYDAQNCGAGAIADIGVIDLQEDMSLMLDGHPNRPLPERAVPPEILADHLGESALMPPYYPRRAAPAACPERFRIDSLANIALF